ncbi:MAG: YqgE/AlgH family protein, partial [Neisseriaceae bacterium]|nr:YqgE/AlgH family protein [Neisseriaceae bacterium]
MENTNLAHHFLIAMPQMNNSFFERSLVYVCEHSSKGALGIVINRPMGITLKELFTQLDLPSEANKAQEPILLGGPVESERGFILHTPKGQWQLSAPITPHISMTT